MKKLTSILLTVVLLAALALPAFAEGQSVSYKDKNWDEQKKDVVTTDETASATFVTADMAAWGVSGSNTPQWYAVSGTVTLAVRPEVLGDVHLILCDNAVLNAPKGITLEDGNSLTVFAQSDGNTMGALKIENFAGNIVKNHWSIAINNADAAIGGRAGSNAKNDGESGKTGASAGALCWKGGSLTVTTTETGSACIGGGNGGNGMGGLYSFCGGGDGGSGADMSVYGGVISLDGTSGVSGGSGGSGGDAYDGTAGSGGWGGSGKSFVVYDGAVTIRSQKGVCVGGGTGGVGGESDRACGGDGGNGGKGGTATVLGGTVTMTSAALCIGGGNGGTGGVGAGQHGASSEAGSGGWGGDGGSGGAVTLSGGTVTLSAGTVCFGGGQGGAGGKDREGTRPGTPGRAGKAAALTFCGGATVRVGADETTATPISLTETVSTDSNDGTYHKPYFQFFFPENAGSVLSQGSMWIVAVVAVAAVAGVAALVVTKKKKPAAANGVEKEDEE